MTTYAISQIKALKHRPNPEKAQKLLEDIANHVLPILTERKFRVRQLAEFFPKRRDLLGMNVNRGQVIYIRLRMPHDANAFFQYEALLETMLHELTHMVHGPHNKAFYQYLEELKQQMERLMVQGLIGNEGARFVTAGPGQALGGYGLIPIRHANDNRAAVLAAEKRAKYHKLLGGATEQRVGGVASDRKLSPAELRVRALEAAERRRRDNERCAVTESLGQAIEILGIDDEDHQDSSQETSWTCTVCTLINSLEDTKCKACDGLKGNERDQAASSAPVSLIDILEEEREKKKRKREEQVIDLTGDD